MPATLRYFQELRSGSPEINYGNTVLVQRDTGVYWLGYVQDIEGDNFFVDFDANTVSAQWINSKQLWPHHFIGVLNRLKLPGLSAYVALRDEVGGPLIFRSAMIIEDLHCMFCAVYLDNSPERRIVPVRQLTARLPSVDGEPSFFGRVNGLVYRKHIVDFGRPHMLRHVKFMPEFLAETCQLSLAPGSRASGVHCRFKMIGLGAVKSFFQCTEEEHSDPCEQHEFSVRVFVRASIVTVTFICFEVHADAAGRSMFWTVDTLKDACQRYLYKQQTRESQLIVNLAVTGCSTVAPFQHENEELRITDLPVAVLGCVLRDLDVLTQSRISQVCALWRLVLHEPVKNRHVILILRPLPVRDSWDSWITMALCANEVYKFSMMLEGSITQNTRVVALVDERTLEERAVLRAHSCSNAEFVWQMQSIVDVLKRKALRLPLLIANNGNEHSAVIGIPFLHLRANDRTCKNYECRTLSSASGWMSACEELWLINYTASGGTGSQHLLQWLYPTGQLWPDEERAFMCDTDEERLHVVIPWLRFGSTEPAAEQCRRFLAAVNDGSPAVTQRVWEKVTAIHGRWVRTLAYPEQWTGIHRFIRMFNSFPADNSPQIWDQIDLRYMDLSWLNKLTFAALDAYYKD